MIGAKNVYLKIYSSDNNENSNEYTTDDEVEIQDVTNRISAVNTADPDRRGISLLDDTRGTTEPVYR